MHLSDTELICAAQSGGENSTQASEEVPVRFKATLRIFAGRARKLYHLDASATDEIVQRAMLAFFNPKIARFDPDRSDDPQAYLRGLIQNAACSYARFLRRGDKHKHNYLNPDNPRRNLPSDVAEIEDTRDPWVPAEARDTAVAVMAMATPEERGLAIAVFYRGQTPEEVGVGLGVNRTTVTRRLGRLFLRYRERCLN